MDGKRQTIKEMNMSFLALVVGFVLGKYFGAKVFSIVKPLVEKLVVWVKGRFAKKA